MGRERQKKKNKSSIPKVRPRRPQRQLNPRSNPVIAAKWDKKLTLAQNYKRLGLTAKLNARTGGTEMTVSDTPDQSNSLPKQPQDPLAIISQSSKHLIPRDVQVQRDPETGAILHITDPQWKKSENPLNDPLSDILDGDHEESDHTREESGQNDIIKKLEQQAAIDIKKRPRHQSQRESEWVGKLVAKYGDDYERMARDTKLNPYQQSAGDIRKRVKVWGKAT